MLWTTGEQSMKWIDTNYKIEALEYLLDKECLPEKYDPLIPFKKNLITQSHSMGYQTKKDIADLPDAEWVRFGLQDENTIRLMRRFLSLYDPRPQKWKEIEKLDLSEKEKLAFQELYYLPGVKQTRAALYYGSGYDSLKRIAEADWKEILEKTALTISAKQLPCIVPLPKEVRTHIAVAKAFTEKANEPDAEETDNKKFEE